jgi:hypothetical protein
MMLAVLHVIGGGDDPWGMVARLMEALPPGRSPHFATGLKRFRTPQSRPGPSRLAIGLQTAT